MDAREQYNIVSDTIVGVNVRWRDNLIQAGVILGCALVGAAIGWGRLEDEAAYSGALLGGLAGLVAGTVLSGAALMIFRFARHLRGKHD